LITSTFLIFKQPIISFIPQNPRAQKPYEMKKITSRFQTTCVINKLMEVIMNSLSIDTIKPDPRSHHWPKGSEVRTQKNHMLCVF